MFPFRFVRRTFEPIPEKKREKVIILHYTQQRKRNQRYCYRVMLNINKEKRDGVEGR